MDDAEEIGRGDRLWRSIPWDADLRYGPPDGLAGRAAAERGLFTGGLLPLPPDGRAFAALVVRVDGPAGPGLADTLRSWGLQSCPAVSALVVAEDPGSVGDVRRILEGSPWEGRVPVEVGSDALRRRLADAEFAVFARPGDVFHPSLATVLARRSRAGRLDVAVWNDLAYPGPRAEGRPSTVRRRPGLERYTLRHVPYVGRAAAVRTEVLRAYPHPLLEALRLDDGHPLHLWLGERDGLAWHAHPETLSAAVGAVGRRTVLPGAALPACYAEPLAALPGLKAVVDDRGPLPYRLEPRPSPRRVSVIIPFRDKAELTCRCLASVFRQSLRARLEVILVDNGSSAAALAAVRDFVAAQAGPATVRILSYDRPFNHSRQCNLGIRESSGDVLVLLNNDAVIAGPDVLERMAAWALLPDVGTVGCRITTPDGRLVSAGIRARADARADVRVPLCEESTQAAYADVVRETFGNTFACAALSRKAFEAAGPLDETDFPVGYNDVEYALRLSRAGYRHVYLGPLTVHHRPRTTRGPCDEAFQTVLLRTRYPELATGGSLQLEAVPIAGASDGPVGRLKQWVRARPMLFRAAKALLGRPDWAAPVADPPPAAQPEAPAPASGEAFRDRFPFEGFPKSEDPAPFLDGLSDDQLRTLNALLPWRSFTADARGRRFGRPAWAGKRDAPQPLGDRRIDLLDERLPLAGKHVLEIGCFEGHHTLALCRRAGRVTAVDARIENVVKTMVRCGFYDARPTVFACDVERRPLDVARLTADVVHHVGVLYHLLDPVAHLEDLCVLAREGLLLDTHVARESEAVERYASGGRTYSCRSYREAGLEDPFSGTSPCSRWLTLAAVREILARGGLSDVLWLEERDERNGARIAMIVRRAR